MHAYVHQWSCQIIYNPRIREGPGLSDGEGVERFWSRLRKMIGVTRVSAVRHLWYIHSCSLTSPQRRRRIWMLDRQARSIGAELRDDLGDWIRRRLKTIATEESESHKILSKCGVPVSELRTQWWLQKAAQLSIRAR